MKLLYLLIVIATTISPGRFSPFEILQNYIENYQEGIARLKKEAAEYQAKEYSLEEEIKHAKPISEIEEYDFIIIGGGTSGSVLASRLSEVPEFKVLLLEAGGKETDITKIPRMSKLLPHTHNSWGYKTTPQTTWYKGNKNHEGLITSGKVLGGTSSINEMIYTRGNARDYDLWADQGNNGWCYNDVLPYFKKSENANLHHFDNQLHKQGGLLNVEESQHISKITENFLEASQELGLKKLDYNGKHQMGVATPQMNTKNGKRYSTFEAFVAPYLSKRKNLVVIPGTQVVEILTSPHTKEAQGVKYLDHSPDGVHIHTAKAKKEVILSSGALNSPQILMLSGVGPKETLEKLGMECTEDLPVGKNLKDQPSMYITYNYNETHHHSEADDLVDYLRDGKGELTTAGVEGLIFMKTKASTDTSDYPDSYIEFMPKKNSFNLRISLAHPKSTGEVTLKSKDNLNWPLVDPNQFSDENDHDMLTMVNAIREAQKLCDTVAFKKAGAVLSNVPAKGCEELKFNSDEYWRCAIRHEAVSGGHYIGTCSMGESKKNSVVDNQLRVHGMHKLRVVDGSVIPVGITGHIQGAVVMVAEKAADMIKSDWLKGVPH